MEEWFSRTELLLGEERIQKLQNSTVAVFGVGGVGGYVVESLARIGVGHFFLVDKDVVSLSNLNRQIIATLATVGRSKVEVMKERILSINPKAEVITKEVFYLPENQDQFDFSSFDYVIDAVDTVSAKIAIIMKAKEKGVPVISSMGTGNKMNPSMFEVADIYETRVDPLAKVMRAEMKKRHVKKLKVVYSKERPLPLIKIEEQIAGTFKKRVPGSLSFAPSTAGLLIASEVVKDLLDYRNERLARKFVFFFFSRFRKPWLHNMSKPKSYLSCSVSSWMYFSFFFLQVLL